MIDLLEEQGRGGKNNTLTVLSQEDRKTVIVPPVANYLFPCMYAVYLFKQESRSRMHSTVDSMYINAILKIRSSSGSC